MHKRTISILVDNDSWILPYAERLTESLTVEGHDAKLVRAAEDVRTGDVNFLLGCVRIVGTDILARNGINLVVHESPLPKGRGFAPIAWQILEGANEIPVHLLEAAKEADAGRIWLSDTIKLNGNELCDEWRRLQGEATIRLCLDFIGRQGQLSPREQKGEATHYARRRPADSRLDVNKTIAEQFSLLRVVNNDDYPAFFEMNGQKYILKITKASE